MQQTKNIMNKIVPFCKKRNNQILKKQSINKSQEVNNIDTQISKIQYSPKNQTLKTKIIHQNNNQFLQNLQEQNQKIKQLLENDQNQDQQQLDSSNSSMISTSISERKSSNLLNDIPEKEEDMSKLIKNNLYGFEYLDFDLAEEKEEVIEDVWENMLIDTEKKVKNETILKSFFYQNIQKHKNFEECLVYKISNKLHDEQNVTREQWETVLKDLFKEHSSIVKFLKSDLLLNKQKDPAWTSHVDTFLYFKGYTGLCLARVGQFLYRQDRKELAYLIQNKTSELCGMDIHPGSYFEKGIFFDHASGLVIGETARIGGGTVILHNVTLGATGKEPHGSNRHPRIGRNCFIGSNVSILGNITIGNNCKVGAGTVCLKQVPDNKTVVGIPGKIIN